MRLSIGLAIRVGRLVCKGVALSRLDDDEKGVSSIDTLGGVQTMATVNESGLYSLIMGSRKPEAKRFKKWVTAEVLPSIRKTGSYGVDPIQALNNSRAISMMTRRVRRFCVPLAMPMRNPPI